MDTNQNPNTTPTIGDSVNKFRDSKKWRMTIIIILIVVAVIMYFW